MRNRPSVLITHSATFCHLGTMESPGYSQISSIVLPLAIMTYSSAINQVMVFLSCLEGIEMRTQQCITSSRVVCCLHRTFWSSSTDAVQSVWKCWCAFGFCLLWQWNIVPAGTSLAKEKNGLHENKSVLKLPRGTPRKMCLLKAETA